MVIRNGLVLRRLTGWRTRRAGVSVLCWLSVVASALPAAGSHIPTEFDCTTTPIIRYQEMSGVNSGNINCVANFFRCYQPTSSAPYYQVLPAGCDATTQACDVQLRVPMLWRGVYQNYHDGTPLAKLYWFDSPTPCSAPGCPEQIALCGLPGNLIRFDHGETYYQLNGLSCGNISGPGIVSLTAYACENYPSCLKREDVPNLDLTVTKLEQVLNCPDPPEWDCDSPNTCGVCRVRGAGPPGGPPAGGPGADTGPGATLRYRGGGVGGPGLPGSLAWRVELGRYWSHDYAQRIVLDPGAGTDAHVWLLTSGGSFRQFKDLVGGVYTTVSPSDEYRTLRRTGGWELEELDGTVHTFDGAGRWSQSVDRNGNATMATYGGGSLSSVSFPDGRQEDFTYHPSGKLATITEIGVDLTPLPPWSYTWSGDDLIRIDRPDGTALELFYDAVHAGYLDRVELVGTSGGRRILGAYDYDSDGNVVDTWRGALNATDPGAVDRWQFSFDDPVLPTETVVTDPLGNASTYELDRDPGGNKPRLLAVSGTCPGCGLGENSQLFYEDPNHPLLATRVIDGNLHETQYSFDPVHGQRLTMTEAVGSPEQRLTAWTYDATYPALPIEKRVPSTSGTGDRVTTWGRDASGNVTTITISGVEGAAGFSLSTSITPNAQGQPLSIDPPGYGIDDVTSHVYDPSRGSLLASSRTDPLVGTTQFGYDPFNRRTSVTDPNLVVSTAAYDDLDRVTEQRLEGAVPAEDLVTAYDYNEFGDLFRVTAPEPGHLTEYEYDAAGRLIAIERKPAAGVPGERQFFELDGAGNRTREELQSWNGSAWVAEWFTDRVFLQRCRPDKVVHADGSETEYDYDCNGNLSHEWDANHTRGVDPATNQYSYDALDRLIQIEQPWVGGTPSTTTYGYDVQDHLVAVTDAEGNETTYVYSDRDLLTSETSPASGATAHTYNEHGELATTTDARAITVSRTVDAADRVTRISYPTAGLQTDFTYDDPSVAFAKGRLTDIARHGLSVPLRYDRFGRLTRDGSLFYEYDKNGNRTAVIYPTTGSPRAEYEYDYSDRPVSLDLEVVGQSVVPVVTAASYKPFGPLTDLALGNGVNESRLVTARYFPDRIRAEDSAASVLLDWDYSTDSVGNVTLIDNLVARTTDRTFDYRDHQYFLTSAVGPWGDLSWSYDRIGNRLSETRGGAPTSYSYPTNPAGGNSPRLSQVGTATYSYDASGNLTQIDDGGDPLVLGYDDESRLAELDRGTQSADLSYDGRSMLVLSDRTIKSTQHAVQPHYSSSGVLMALVRQVNPSGPAYLASEHLVLYFDGRPVAVRKLDTAPSSTTWYYYTTDHLGSPALITDDSGAGRWSGGFEPFGADYGGAANKGEAFLRLPGQWEEPTWESEGLASGLFYNVHRSYQPATGRYTRVDPLVSVSALAPYRYGFSNPLRFMDPMGLQALPLPAPPPPEPIPFIRPVPPPTCAPAPGPGISAGAAAGGALTVVLNELFNPSSAGAPGASDFADPSCKPKCGDCDPNEHGFLQSAIREACKSGPSRCTPGMSPQQLEENFWKQIQCYFGRLEINNRCFRGGDPGHQEAAENARRGALRCLELLTRP